MHYSIFNLVRQALIDHRGWKPAWRDAAPKPAYDIVVVGGGGHGLATAHYLSKVHGLSNVAVVEKGPAMPAGTPPSSARTTSCPATIRSTSSR